MELARPLAAEAWLGQVCPSHQLAGLDQLDSIHTLSGAAFREVLGVEGGGCPPSDLETFLLTLPVLGCGSAG